MIESTDITGNHKLVFDEAKHVYILDGEKIPGATGVKKAYPPSDGLIRYFINQGIEEFKSGKKLKEQAAIGTITHDYAYARRTGKPYEIVYTKESDVDKINHRINLVDKWLAKLQDDIISAEQIVASVKYKFGGKYDCLVKRNGKVILQDYKSAKGFFEDQFIQLGGYAFALREWSGINVEGIEVIRFADDADEPKSFLIDDEDQIEDFELQFLRLRQTLEFQYKWKTMFDKIYKAEHPYIRKAK